MAGKKTLETVAVVKEVKLGFWQTSQGILIKRIGFMVISVVIAQLIVEITNNPTLFGTTTPIIYVVLTLVRDLVDPQVPNSTNSVVVK